MEIIADMKKLTKCSTCLDYMDGENRHPIGLGCGHVICKSCSSKLVKTVNSSRGRKLAECPECKGLSYTRYHPQPIYQFQALCEAVANYHPPAKKTSTVSAKGVGEKNTDKENFEKMIPILQKRNNPSRNSGSCRAFKLTITPPKEIVCLERKRNAKPAVFKRITRSKTEQSAGSTRVEVVDID